MAISYFLLVISYLTLFFTTKIDCAIHGNGIQINLPIRLCSENFCDLFECVPLGDCNPGEVVEPKGSVCGCCDSCVRILKENEECGDVFTPPDGKPVAKCDKELMCDDGTPRVCTKVVISGDSNQLPKCIHHVMTIEQLLSEFNETANVKYVPSLWRPDCDEQGNYKPKQCKKNTNKCFCVAPDGERLFGQAEFALATNMTCLCSLAMYHKSIAEGKKWMTHLRGHCTPMGNFAKLQCSDDSCFCVDEQTGETTGRVIKENQKEFLPCYKLDDFDDHNENDYFSTCETQFKREQVLQYEFFLKGIEIIRPESVNCDLDGTYSPKQCASQVCHCTDGTGNRFKAYGQQIHDLPSQELMNCRCARDELDIERNGAQYSRLSCMGMGNFKHFQSFGNERFCVDEDGDTITMQIRENDGKLENECRTMVRHILQKIPSLPGENTV